MLAAPVEACPDTPAAAVAFMRRQIGDPIRADADTELLSMLEESARSGRGMAPDPEFAARLARHAWLVAADRDVAGWSEAECEAWLVRPETIAALEARVSAAPTARAIWLLSDLLLRRGLPGYDPARAAALLEASPELHSDPVRLRLAGLLSDGAHMPPDYRRAAKPFRYDAGRNEDIAGPAQQALLDIGRRAARKARTQAERLTALSVLGPAALDGFGDSRALYTRLLRQVRAPRSKAPLPADRIDWLSAELDTGFAHNLDMLPDDTPPGRLPILIDGLIGPDGRLATVRLTQSSGVAPRDRAVLSNYLRAGDRVDLSSVAKGRAVWVALPPVDPMLTYSEVYRKRKARCPACM